MTRDTDRDLVERSHRAQTGGHSSGACDPSCRGPHEIGPRPQPAPAELPNKVPRRGWHGNFSQLSHWFSSSLPPQPLGWPKSRPGGREGRDLCCVSGLGCYLCICSVCGPWLMGGGQKTVFQTRLSSPTLYFPHCVCCSNVYSRPAGPRASRLFCLHLPSTPVGCWLHYFLKGCCCCCC